MPPIVPIVLVLFVTSAFVAYISLTYLQKPAETPVDEKQTDAELRARLEAERQQRLAAQEVFFNNTIKFREQRQQRIEMNARPLATEAIPADASNLTLLRLYIIDYDAYYALVYLLPEHIVVIDADEDDPDLHAEFFSLWKSPDAAIWAWQDDNIFGDYGESDLKQAAIRREQAMMTVLRQHGWAISEDETASRHRAVHYVSRDTPPEPQA